MSPRIQIDTLVSGKLGTTDTVAEGRVYRMMRSGVGIIRDDGRQGFIYEPEFVADPRPQSARRDIPARFR